MVARPFRAIARATLFGIAAWALPLAVALLLPPFAGTVRAETPRVEWGEKLGEDLAGLLAYARTHNPEFVTERLEAEATRAGAAAAGALPDPRFQIELMDVNNAMSGRDTFSLLPGQVGETRYRVVQMLPYPGKRALEARAADARAAQREARAAGAWLEAAAAIKTAWMRYYAADRETALIDEMLAAMVALEDATLARYRRGLATQEAVLRVHAEITGLRLRRVEIEQALRSARATVNGLLDRSADAPLARPGAPPALPERLDPTALVARLVETNPAVVAQVRAADAARFARAQSRLDRYPDFAVGITYNQPRMGADRWDVMLELNIPLQGPRRARNLEAERMLDAAHARLTAEAARLRTALGTALAGLDGGRERLRLIQTALLPQAEAGLDAARAAFATGRADFDTVLQAWRQVLDTRLALLGVEVDSRLALFELEKLVGEPL